MPAGGAAVLGGGAIGLIAYGAIKKAQDAKAAANNTRPTYNIPQEEYDNQRLAESQAGQGMSATSRQAYQNSADSGLANTTDAILRGGGDPNGIGNAYNSYQNGINNLSIYDDQVRMQHLNGLVAQNQRMSADKDKAWQVNQFAPWADKAQALALKQQADQQLISQGVGIAGQALTMGLGGGIGLPTGGGAQKTAAPNNVPIDNGINNFTNSWGAGSNSFAPSSGNNNMGGSPYDFSPPQTGGGNTWNGIGIIPYQ